MIGAKVNKQCVLAADIDFNTVLTSGFYRLGDVTKGKNYPPNAVWGQMIVIYGGGDTIVQMAFSYNNASQFNLRVGACKALGATTDAWTEWKLFKSA